MSGIYIHIPFCKQACHYCDFHFSTNQSRKNEMVQAIIEELKLRRNYLKEETVSSVYFGGGTPSLLDKDQIRQILESIKSTFSLSADTEITLEANPDDISEQKLNDLHKAGVNRLSIGVQSFNSDVLKWMNRAHDEHEAIRALELINKSKITNYSVDLIYGIPIVNSKVLSDDIEQLLKFNPPHVSAYCLTIEEKTVFGHRQKKGALKEVSEEIAANQFLLIKDKLNDAGYIHYEVSNYSLPNRRSYHNENYWKGIPYLGLGPGAHSFDGLNRHFNVSNNSLYMKQIANADLPIEEDLLDNMDRLNEYIMTSLRTIEGLNNNYCLEHFGIDLFERQKQSIQQFESQNLCHVDQQTGYLKLTTPGLLLADKLASDLFIVD